MSDFPVQVVLCNGANLPSGIAYPPEKILHLEYRDNTNSAKNVKLSLPAFYIDVYHLPDRILDLLEIAAYVFSADRLTKRGSPDSVEYHSWARSFHFYIKVRDKEFWSKESVRKKLEEALKFMSGDRSYEFTFLSGHSTPPASLFDSKECQMEPDDNTSVVLFSGGLDSLTGVIQLLETTDNKLCLISHRSQPGITRTQNQLFKALARRYPNRLLHFKFYCSLQGIRSVEETQRTRAFLFNSIAYAISHVLTKGTFYVFENGITSLNFLRRQDQINGRASRTTHPKTLGLMNNFFQEFGNKQMKTEEPFLWNTKADLFNIFREYNQKGLISSTVSCSRTFKHLGPATHCGGCFQCVDRRFAAFASELNEVDDTGIYDLDFIKDEMPPEVKTTVVDYVRQAKKFAEWNIDHFYQQMLSELTDVEEYISGINEEDKISKIWDLCKKHGDQVLQAILKIRAKYDNPYSMIAKDSFIHVISEREYLKEPIQRLINDLCARFSRAIPIAFQKNRPKDENDFNDKLSSILSTMEEDFDREHPSVPFALAKSVPDHSQKDLQLFIESKYIRGSTSPSKVSEGIAADITKYSKANHVLFVVYDPDRCIVDDNMFKQDFEQKGRCTIAIFR